MSLYADAVKEGTFLHHYLRYCSPLETPLAYDFWCGMWLLSTAMGRDVIVARPHAPVYLNLYTVLCADAGTTRKSTAVRRCEAVYRGAGLDETAFAVTGAVTPERLVEQMGVLSDRHGRAEVNLIVSELVTLLGKESYTIALPGLLTDLYDCPAIRDYSRVSTGRRVALSVYLTLLGASTPSWLVRAINPDVVEGGFTSRCLFIVAEQPKQRVAWPDAEAHTEDSAPHSVAGLSSELLRLRMRRDRWATDGISLTDNAKERFTRWYNTRPAGDTDPFIASFTAREDHHALRVAALLAVNEDHWIINAHHMNAAIKIIADVKNGAAVLFGSHKESRRLVAGIDKLRAVLMEAGDLGIAQNELNYKLRRQMTARELEYATTIMWELSMVQRFEVATGGRKKTVWRATNKIALRNLNALLTERMSDQ